MAEVTIDGKTFDRDSLSEGAKKQLNMVQVTDAEIQRLQIMLAIAQTARIAYFAALNEQLAAEKKAAA